MRQFDDLQLGSLELFCTVVERGSFTAAANTLGITPAAVSRSVARLEARLQARLFVRSTRRILLSEAGRAYYQHCRMALSQLLEAERELSGQQSDPVGLLRISMPSSYGPYRVLPLLPRFRERYPGVRVEAHVSNRSIDFAEEGYDVAIRVRPPEDSSLIVRPLESVPLVVVATPECLQRHGRPEHPEDLLAMDCVQFMQPKNGRPMPWEFRVDGKELRLETRGNLLCSEEILSCVSLARAGGGFFQSMRFLVEEDIAQGRLIPVLEDYAGSIRSVSLLYPHRRHTPLRVRAFVEFLVQALRPESAGGLA